jgi:hypothetical protein
LRGESSTQEKSEIKNYDLLGKAGLCEGEKGNEEKGGVWWISASTSDTG